MIIESVSFPMGLGQEGYSNRHIIKNSYFFYCFCGPKESRWRHPERVTSARVGPCLAKWT